MTNIEKIKAILVVMFLLPLASIFIPFRRFVKTKFICWFSSHFWDVHDFPVEFGGDGFPSHFHTYKCNNCKKEFGL